jgi:hypothetical protein
MFSGKAAVGLPAGAVINKFKMKKHIALEIDGAPSVVSPL